MEDVAPQGPSVVGEVVVAHYGVEGVVDLFIAYGVAKLIDIKAVPVAHG